MSVMFALLSSHFMKLVLEVRKMSLHVSLKGVLPRYAVAIITEIYFSFWQSKRNLRYVALFGPVNWMLRACSSCSNG